MKTLFVSKTFKKDLKLSVKRGKAIGKMQTIIDLLLYDKPLPLKNRPHKLSGEYTELWECHIEPDWLMIYDITEVEVRLYRIGSHSDLFG
ncbi:MAG: type II toxin-antitoxin system YafQ family toxin [Alphaproteobacteria bacterium]|nr:type II toxin-antitoxin system YafQ family toxin [Alphaproteobacteria bacterium]